jgi:hypothetical protein
LSRLKGFSGRNSVSRKIMRRLRILAAAALAAIAATAHADHFQYAVNLTGTYSLGGTDGCTPPDFDQPACPRPGKLSALLTFDTPSGLDGSYMVGSDIMNFVVTLGSLPEDFLFGGVNLSGGIPNGSVEAFDESERFSFDWASQGAWYSYDFGYHGANGSFSGTLLALPEPPLAWPMLAGLAAFAWAARRGRTANRA